MEKITTVPNKNGSFLMQKFFPDADIKNDLKEEMQTDKFKILELSNFIEKNYEVVEEWLMEESKTNE